MNDQLKEFRKKLESYTPQNMEEKLPILKRLLKRHYAAKPAVDIERAYFITESRQQSEKSSESIQIKRAKAVSNYLSNRKVVFYDDNLLGGATTSKEIGAPLYPEFFGIGIWPELDSISTRKANPQFLSETDADVLNFDIFPYWMERTMIERVRKVDPEKQSLMEKMIIFNTSKATTISHTTPYYEVVLKKGINGIINDAKEKEEKSGTDDKKRAFYQSMQIAMEGVLNYANNISKKAAERAKIESDPERKIILQKISNVCSKVPANSASSYYEAVNSLWICQVAVFAENSNMAINPGRLDQILYPYFIKDYNDNKLSIENALTITGCLWLKIADNVNLVPEAAERLFGGAGAVPAVTLGGVDSEGNDAVNELTYLLLKITELLPIRDPNVNARYHPDVNSEDYRNEVCRVILSTKAIPAFHNDVQNIKTLEEQGETKEDASDYAIVGCVELGSVGRDYSASSSIFMMLYTILYMALHNGKTPATGDKVIGPQTGAVKDFNTMDDVWNAYEQQLEWVANTAISLNNLYGKIHQENLPTPILSCFFEGPMKNGKDLIFGGAKYNSSGVTNIGFADVCDSMNAIEDICFNGNHEMNMTLEELVNAVDLDFKDYEKLQAYLQNHAPKYGTDDPIAIKNSKKLIELNYKAFNGKKNYRNGNYRVAYWTMTNHAGYGKIAKALPNGRKEKTVFSSGITPVSQIETPLTTALDSVAFLNSKQIPGSYALNMKLTPMGVTSANLDKFGSIIQTYFNNGGQQVQFNIHDYEVLRHAKAYPDDYPHLLVRVSGYSAYFRSLNEAMKDELITRSQYNLLTGKLVHLTN